MWMVLALCVALAGPDAVESQAAEPAAAEPAETPVEAVTLEPVVASASSLPARVTPSGQGRMVELLRGDNAFIATLELAGGAEVPLHRDSTEEYLVVQKGAGTLYIDGESYDVGPDTVVFMPANAEVRFVNGKKKLVALQVFAGPEPAKKYEAWPPE